MIFKVRGGRGDQLCMTPAVRRYAIQNPNEEIKIEWQNESTRFPDVWKYNPYVRDGDVGGGEKILHPPFGAVRYDQHIVDHFAGQAGVTLEPDVLADRVPVLCLGLADEFPSKICSPAYNYAGHSMIKGGYVTIDTGAGWRTREWDVDRFRQVALELLSSTPLWVVQIGTSDSPQIRIDDPRFVDYRGETTWRQAATLISVSSLFIGNDSAGAHVAASHLVPAVVIFSVVPARVYAHHNLLSHPVSSGVCNECEIRKFDDQAANCPLNLDPPKCLDSVSVDMVMTGVKRCIALP